MNRSLLVIIALFMLFATGCRKKTYYVHIIKSNNTEHIDTIRASSDSIAYAKAYKYYMVSQLVENIVKDEMAQNNTPIDQRFYVKTKRGKLIHFNLSDKDKSTQEQKAKDAVGGIAKTDDDDND